MFSIESFVRERDKKINKQKKTVYQFNATRGTIVRVWANLKTQNNHSHTDRHSRGGAGAAAHVLVERISPPLGRIRKTCARPTMCETVCIGEETKGKHQKYHKTNTYQQGKKETQNYSKQQIPQTANVYTMYDKQ